MEEIKVYVDYEVWSDSTKIFITARGRNKRISVAKPIEFIFEDHEEGTIVDPTIKLPRDFSRPFLQAFANMLEKHGIRPETKPILENELTAVKYHLEDMRRLVFRKK